MKNKTNHQILSNSHPSATANKAINTLPQMREGGVTKPTETSQKYRNFSNNKIEDH